MLTLGFRPGMISYYFVMQLALENRGAVKAAPAIAGSVKDPLDLV